MGSSLPPPPFSQHQRNQLPLDLAPHLSRSRGWRGGGQRGVEVMGCRSLRVPRPCCCCWCLWLGGGDAATRGGTATIPASERHGLSARLSRRAPVILRQTALVVAAGVCPKHPGHAGEAQGRWPTYPATRLASLPAHDACAARGAWGHAPGVAARGASVRARRLGRRRSPPTTPAAPQRALRRSRTPTGACASCTTPTWCPWSSARARNSTLRS